MDERKVLLEAIARCIKEGEFYSDDEASNKAFELTETGSRYVKAVMDSFREFKRILGQEYLDYEDYER